MPECPASPSPAWSPALPHRLLDPILPEPREAFARRPPKQGEHPLDVHRFLDPLPWHEPDRAVHGLGADAALDDGPARVPRFGFQVYSDAHPLAVELLGLTVAEQSKVKPLLPLLQHPGEVETPKDLLARLLDNPGHAGAHGADL